MGRYGAPGWLLVMWSLVIALVTPPATTWSQAQPPFPPPFPPETQAALQQIVEQRLTEAGSPGAAVGVWIPGRGTWVHAQGTGDLATGAPIRVADKFRIGSITKTFAATVLLQLVDEGRLQLEDHLEQYVPGVPNGDRITIRQVLGMTAGIFSYTSDATFEAEYDANPLMPFSLEELLVILRRHPPDFLPGEGVHYSDTNYYLLGLIIEQLTGQRVGEAIDQRIVQPLRLTSTSYPTTPDMPEPYAHGYNAESNGALRDVTRSNPGAAGAAGAMLSTLDDLRLWTEALAHGALLSPTTQRERLQWSAFPGGEAVNSRYGLGIQAFDSFLGHSGGIAGYESMAFHLPEANATIVVLANKSGLFGGGAAQPIFLEIANLLFPGRLPPLAATARAERPAPPTPPAGQGDFAGLIDIGGRRLYLECRGTGAPTVILEAGYRSSATTWSDDLVQPERPRAMVLAGVAGFTRVCLYERPGVAAVLDDGLHPSRSDPVPQPRTAEAVVADLHTLLQSAGVPGPYVLVGHSLGGAFVRLYAATYPAEVLGIVLVDAWYEELRELQSPEQWAAYVRLNSEVPPELAAYRDLETLDFAAVSATVRQAVAAQPLPTLPLAVLAKSQSFGISDDELGFSAEALDRAWRAAQERLATLVPQARYTVASESGHYIQLQQPALVIEATRQVVAGVRDQDTWYDLAACCAP